MQLTRVAAVGAACLLAGCSFATDTLWPSLTGDEPAGRPATAERVQIAPSRAESNAQPTLGPGAPPRLGTTDFTPQPYSAAPTSGTFVGQKVGQLRVELGRLQQQLSGQNQELQQIRVVTTENAQRYHGTVAAITARLQLGTTPGNPVLVSQWNAAQGELDRISGDIAGMNTLANRVAANSSLAAYVLESARAAYSLSGAIEADHQQLAILEDETNRTVVLVDRLLNELNEDVGRQTAYVGTERGNLTTLSQAIKNGELFGPSLLTRAYSPRGDTPVYGTSATPRSGFASGGRQPLVVIRFDRPDVPYQQALYSAVSRTLENRPDALFDLVAVAPGTGGAAATALSQSDSKRYANDVLRALTDMGLPASRVSLASTTNPAASSNEVHLYIR